MNNVQIRDFAVVLLLALFGGLFFAVGRAQLSTIARRWGSLGGNYDDAGYFSSKDVEFALALGCGTIGLLILAWLVIAGVCGIIAAVAARLGMVRFSRSAGMLTPRFMKSLIGLVFGVSLLAAPGAFADETNKSIEVPSPAFVSNSITLETLPPSELPIQKVATQAETVKSTALKTFETKDRETMLGIPAQDISQVVTSGQRQSSFGQREIAVTSGDSLWAIVAKHLGPQASSAEIHAEWPKWYERNKSIIGENPDLILPGTVLINPNF